MSDKRPPPFIWGKATRKRPKRHCKDFDQDTKGVKSTLPRLRLMQNLKPFCGSREGCFLALKNGSSLILRK